ncbi:MAG: hypothetical protein ACLF0P_11005 [Thermoanaerobaculia bacterium]
MKRIHLLRFAGAPEDLAPLATAAAAEGLRVGWLDLTGAASAGRSGGPGDDGREPPGRADASAPANLEQAVSAGSFRAVTVAPGRTVSLKAVAGPPVLRDLLREHFLGCALVVVRVDRDAAGRGDEPAGEAATAGRLVRDADAALDEAPWLKVEGDVFAVEPPGRAGRRWTAAELAARLRKPRPWE